MIVAAFNMYAILGAASFAVTFIGHATMSQPTSLNLVQAVCFFQFIAMTVASAASLHTRHGTMRPAGIDASLLGFLTVDSANAEKVWRS
jgi:hypothetical protein